MGCPIKVGTAGFEPYVIMTENCIHNGGSTKYKLTGLSVDILKLVCEKMNLTTDFLALSQNVSIYNFENGFGALEDGLSDVLTGIIPLAPFVVTSSFDPTLPYLYDNFKLLVPCPIAIPGTEKVLTTFSVSVWLTIGLVLLLTTAVFWCAGNGPYRSVCNETHTYQSLFNCFHDAWAVLVAVSVPQQPTTSSLRVFFFLYVRFCFAISTVFQAFFVSYLVEPTNERKMETLDEFLDSDLVYCYFPLLQMSQDPVASPEFVRLFEKKTLKEECNFRFHCVERILTKRDIATPTTPFFSTYYAKERGIVDVGKIICPINEAAISGSLTIIFKKGNPLLDRFNILMRRYLEAGFMERLWAELQHRASLRGRERFSAADGDIYFAFSVPHLVPAFVVLLVGTVLSSAVFIGELIVNCLCRRIEKKNSRMRRVKICVSVIAQTTSVD